MKENLNHSPAIGSTDFTLNDLVEFLTHKDDMALVNRFTVSRIQRILRWGYNRTCNMVALGLEMGEFLEVNDPGYEQTLQFNRDKENA